MKFEVKTIQFAPNIYEKSFKRRFEFESISLKLQRPIKSPKKKKEKEEREKEGKKGGALGRLWKEKEKRGQSGKRVWADGENIRPFDSLEN